MLNCVYHFTGNMQVVDDEEKETLIATGAWFDHPLKAQAYKEELSKMTFDEPKPKKRQKDKPKGDDYEKSSDE